MRVYFFRGMNNKVFIWVGYFADDTAIERYIRTQNTLSLEEPDEDDEIAMSIFAEDIDLPVFEVAFQQYCKKQGDVDWASTLSVFLGKATEVTELAQRLEAIQKPLFNTLLLIKGHDHTRYYRGTARPGSPIRFLGTFEGIPSE